MARVVVFGGTGFVGSRVMERLSQQGVASVGASRTGRQPNHLTKAHGGPLPHVEWVKADASGAVDPAMLKGASAVITTIGSPPIPSVTKALFDHQVLMSGTCNINVIDAAREAGVARVVLCSASIPFPMRLNSFGYYVGKTMACNHLEAFAAEEGKEGVVLRPGMIYGTRHTDSMGIPLTPFMAPIACLHAAAKKVVPAVTAVDSPISVDRVAQLLVDCALAEGPAAKPFRILENDEMISNPHCAAKA